MGAVRMDDAARLGVGGIDAAVQGQGLGGTLTAGLLPADIHFGQPRRVEPAQAGVGGRDQEAAVGAHADVAGGGMHIAARKQRFADAADLVAQRGAHDASRAKALVKKSELPKLPDFSATCSVWPPQAGDCTAVQGTPGSICGPICICRTPSACTTAPEVSPPATTSWRTPRSTRPTAMPDKARSTISPACATPSFACTALTAAESAVACTSTGPSASSGPAQASAWPTTSSPAAMASGSMARLGRPLRLKFSTCALVATEQLPEITACRPAAGGRVSAAAPGVVRIAGQFCGRPIAMPEPAVTRSMPA